MPESNAEKIGGYLMVGTLNGEVVVNLDRDRTGHLTYSPRQAREFAKLLEKKAAEVEAANPDLAGPRSAQDELHHFSNLGRDMLLEWDKAHRAICHDPKCVEPANVLGWLAHCLGATPKAIAAIGKHAAVYDAGCKGCGSPNDSPAARHAAGN